MATAASKTFLITGVSSGLGRAFAKGALDAGHRVIGTVRRAGDAEAFGVLSPARAHPLLLDVTDFDAIAAAVADAERQAGAVDVLVNNAGYGHEGVLEEASLDDLQRQLAANVFGPVAMMKAVLPGMRERRRGHIVNVTSMGGFITMPGVTFYCGSKFALEGISEALGKEVAGFGIRVTALGQRLLPDAGCQVGSTSLCRQVGLPPSAASKTHCTTRKQCFDCSSSFVIVRVYKCGYICLAELPIKFTPPEVPSHDCRECHNIAHAVDRAAGAVE